MVAVGGVKNIVKSSNDKTSLSPRDHLFIEGFAYRMPINALYRLILYASVWSTAVDL